MRSGTTHLLRPLTAAGLLVLVGVPLLFIVLQAIFPQLGSGSLSGAFSRILPSFSDPQILDLTRNTLLLGLCVSVAAALVGVPLGVARALLPLPLPALWDAVLLVPFMIPPYIAAMGWILVLQPRGFLQQVTGMNAGGFLFSFPGLVFIMTMHLFPAVYFAVSRAVAGAGGHLSTVARVFGAGPLAAFRHVTLPLVAPALTGSMLLVFAATVEEFGTPAALAPQTGYTVLVTAIDHRVADWPIDLPGASSLSMILVAMALCAFLLQRRMLQGRSYTVITGKPQQRRRGVANLGLRWLLAGVFSFITLLALVLPLFGVFATALTRTISGGLHVANLTLRNYELILADSGGAMNALLTSFGLGLVTALLTAVVGTAAALSTREAFGRRLSLVAVLTALPNAIPGIVVSVGLILAWNQPWLPLSVYGTTAMLVLAYSCILLPYPVRYASSALAQVGTNLEAAARVSGAGALTSFGRILLPLIAPSLLSAMMLVFAVSSRELVASILLAPVGQPTIATFIWKQFEQGSLGLGMAMSTVAILLTTLAMALVAKLGNRLISA